MCVYTYVVYIYIHTKMYIQTDIYVYLSLSLSLFLYLSTSLSLYKGVLMVRLRALAGLWHWGSGSIRLAEHRAAWVAGPQKNGRISARGSSIFPGDSYVDRRSFLVLTCFPIRDYKIRLEKELPRSLQVWP